MFITMPVHRAVECSRVAGLAACGLGASIQRVGKQQVLIETVGATARSFGSVVVCVRAWTRGVHTERMKNNNLKSH